VDLTSDEASGDIFESRVRLFLVDNERGKRVGVRIADQTHVMEASGPNGHFTGTLTLPAAVVEKFADRGQLNIKAVTGSGDNRDFSGVVHLIRPEGVSVISDIDDTIKVSQVTDKKQLMANTFTRPFRAVDGMAEKYADWAEAGASFHYVSSSPWQLYPPLERMTREAGFPEATFELKQFRLKDSSLMKLFADPLETKRQVIEPILERYPRRKFILVGDSGEKDPEVYAHIARKYPEQVSRIYIRDVTGEAADSARYKEAFKDIPSEKWMIFSDPASVTLPK